MIDDATAGRCIAETLEPYQPISCKIHLCFQVLHFPGLLMQHPLPIFQAKLQSHVSMNGTWCTERSYTFRPRFRGLGMAGCVGSNSSNAKMAFAQLATTCSTASEP